MAGDDGRSRAARRRGERPGLRRARPSSVPATSRASRRRRSARAAARRTRASSARASSSARMPMPAMRGRIGSGARTDDAASSWRRHRRPAQPVQEQVQLPGLRLVDLLQDAVQALDLDVALAGRDGRTPRSSRRPRPGARGAARSRRSAAPSRSGARVSERLERSRVSAAVALAQELAARPARSRRGRTRRRSARACGRARAPGPRRCAARRSARRSCGARPGTRPRPPRRASGRWTAASKTRYSQVTARRCRNGVSAERRIRKSQSSE